MTEQKPTVDASVDSTDAVIWRNIKATEETSEDKLKLKTLETSSSGVAVPADAPKTIASFSIKEELGRGAFGTVYRAVNEDEEREVAIKIFAGRVTTKEAEVRFKREVEIASSLDHPNISSIIDYGTHKGLPYLVMRVIRGETIYQKVEKEGSIPPGEAARIIQRMAQAMHHAHSRNIIHRDLKPSNVILEKGEPVIVDLGLSKSMLTTESFTGKGDLLGSPLFMAPEQLFGEKADPRSDVFGLGGLLYYMLVAETPRSLEDFRKRATPEARLPREVPYSLAAICTKALANKPEKRFRSAADMAEVLDDWIAGREPRVEPRRYSIILLLALLAGILFGGFLTSMFFSSHQDLLFDKNIVNSYSVGGATVQVKDGRTQINVSSELRFPCLKVIVDDLETWSPPRQELDPDRRYFVGRLPDAFLLARASFSPAPGRIRGKIFFEPISVSKSPSSHLLPLNNNGNNYFKGFKEIDGTLIEVEGQLQDSDKLGHIWSSGEAKQLLVTVGGKASWSPPRPMNRTDHMVEYPLGVVDKHFVTGRFLQKSEDGRLILRLQLHSPKSPLNLVNK